MSKPIDQERALFEAHYHLATLDRDPISGTYYDHETRCLWDAWQARASVQPAGVAVPDGYVLVPQSMLLDAAALEALVFVSGGIARDDGVLTYHDSIMWVGELRDDDDKPVYGLHAFCTECEEEGSTTLAEFAAPHPVSGEQKRIEMADIVRALEAVPGAPILTSDMCHAIAQAINARRGQPGEPS